jgi:FkbM family methyltransferase
MLGNRMTRRLVHRWARNRDVTISAGIGAGLKFNAAHSNPAYSLGTNEPPVQQILAQNLQAGDVLYDIGANVGFFTILGAKLVGSTGHVYAFEPVPENAAAVHHNASLNNLTQVTVLHRAVSDRDGSGELLLAYYSGGSALSTVDTPPPDLKGIIDVGVVTVDSLVGRQAILPPTVVKIDVEGAEINVLRGMSQTMNEHKPLIIYEIDDEDEASFNQKQEACAAFLIGNGYSVTRIEDSYQEIEWHVGHFIARPLDR